MVLSHDNGVNIDVLVHPYWSDFVENPIDIPNAQTHEKTRRWKSAIDELGERGQMLVNIELLLDYNKQSVHQPENQSSLFGLMAAAPASSLKLANAKPATMEEKLAWEKELLGLYVSGHPLDQYKEKLQKRSMSIGEMKTRAIPGTTAVAAGMVEGVRIILTKSGDQMAFIKMMDETGFIEAVLFPKIFTEYKKLSFFEFFIWK